MLVNRPMQQSRTRALVPAARGRLWIPLLALALVALAVFLAGDGAPPAEAQGTATTYVSNLGKDVDDADNSTSGQSLAQDFTTGANSGGYALGSIELSVVEALDSTARGKLRVELWSSQSTGGTAYPSSKIGDSLTIPATVSAGTVSFAAPANTTLSANTTYFVVIYTTDATTVKLNATNSDDEDSGAASGWSIGNTIRFKQKNDPTDHGTWLDILYSSEAFLIAVKGTASGMAQSTNANLSALTAETATGETATYTSQALTPSTFDKATTSYTATVANTITHAKLTPTVEDTGKATVEVGKSGNLNTVTSGNASGAIALDPGDNAIQVKVTAEDTTTTKTYTVTIARAPAAPTMLSATAGSAKLDLTWDAVTGAGSYDVHYTSAAVGDLADDATTVGTNVATQWVDASHTGTAASDSITGLDNGTEYRVRVPLVAGGASGAWATTKGTPAASALPTVSLSSDSPVTEGSDVTVTAELSAALGSAVTIPVTLATGTASSGDYGSLANITINANATTGTGTVSTTQDTDVEANETFTVSLGSSLPAAVQAGSPSSVTVTINDNDTAAAPTALKATAGNLKLDLTWTAPSGALSGYDVHYTSAAVGDVADDAAVDNDTTNVGTAWVPASHSGTGASGSVTGLDNGTEYRVRVRGKSAAGNGAWATTKGTPAAQVITLTSSDADGSVAESGSASDREVTLTATLPSGAAQAVTITLSRATSSTADGNDYTLSSTTISIAMGDDSGTTTLTITDDDVDEDDETLTLTATHTATTKLYSDGSLSLTITDDDTAGVTVSESSRTVEVGETTTYTVKLNSKPTHSVTIAATSDDTDKATVAPLSRTFSTTNWSTPQQFTVTGKKAGDLDVDHLATSTDSKYGTSLSINHVDVTVSASTKTYKIEQIKTANEGANAAFTVTLGRAPTEAAGHTLNVRYSYPGSTATAADLSSPPATVTVAQSSTTATLTVPIAQDALVEGAESVTVTISTTTSGWNPAATGANVATIRIRDDEAANAKIAFHASDAAATAAYTASVAENLAAGFFTVPVTISALPQSNTTFDVEVVSSGTTATSPGDYSIGTKSVTFGNSGSKTKNVSIALLDGPYVESDETIRLKIKENPTRQLVSNIKASTVSNLNIGPYSIAQAFSVGSGDTEFTLTSIEAQMNSAANAAQAATFRAELWSDASNKPSSKLTDLTVPATWAGNSIVSFAAPSSAVLSASTTYHLVLYTVGGYNPGVQATSSDADDPGGLAGWSVANDSSWQARDQPAGGEGAPHGNAVSLRVNGFAGRPSGMGYHYARDGSGSTATLTIEDDDADAAKIAFGTNAAGTVKYTRSHNETASATVRVTVSHLPAESTAFTVETVTSGPGAGTATEYTDTSNPGDFRIADKTVTFGSTGAMYRDVSITLNDDSLVENDQTIELRLKPLPTTATTPVTLVSNHGQTTGAAFSTNNYVGAQAFTTGSNASGYTLTAIEAAVGQTWVNNPQRESVRAELWSHAAATGNPDEKIVDLVVPFYFADTLSFEPSTNTVLEANTAYYFLLYTTGTYNMEIDRVTSPNEDSGGAAGWSITDGRRSKNAQTPGDAAAWTGEGSSMRITVKGSVFLSDLYARHASGSTATLTIEDNEARAAKVAFGGSAAATTKHTATPSENAGTLTVPITITALPEEESDFTVSVSGTATKNTDYSLSAETFTFNKSSGLTQNLTITLTNDPLVEDDQTIELEIASGDGFFSKYARHAQGKLAGVTIQDDEQRGAKIAIGASATSTTKHTATGAEGDGTLTVPITISALPESSTTFAVEVLSSGTTARDSDDTNNAAGNPKDYDFTSKEVTFTDTGAKSKDLTINIADDNVEEDDEAIQLRIVRADNPKDDLGDYYVRHADGATSTITLTSDDAVSTVTLSTNVTALGTGEIPAYEGGRVPMTVTADIPVGPGGWQVNVERAPKDLYLVGIGVYENYCNQGRDDLTQGIACPNDVTLPGQFTIQEGQTAATGHLTVTRDSRREDTPERLLLRAKAQRGGVTKTTGTLDMRLNEGGTGINLGATALEVLPTETATYTVSLRGEAPTANVTVTPTSDATDKATVSGALTFTSTNYTEPQEVTVTGVAAGSATITHVSTSTDSKYSLSSSVLGSVRVTVSEPANNYQITPATTAAEGESAELKVTLGALAPSTDNPEFTVDRSRNNDVKILDGSTPPAAEAGLATVADDLGASPTTTLTVTAGERTYALTETIADDDLVEGDEHYYLVISTTETGWDPVAMTHPADRQTCAQDATCARVTITDPDAAEAKIAFGNAAAATTVHAASVGEGAGTLAVPVTISALPKSSTTFNVQVLSSGTTATEDTDYSIATKSVTFDSTDTSTTKNVTVTITNDTDAEGDETIQLRIVAADAPINDLGDHYQRDPNGSRATITITDNDAAAEVSKTAVSVDIQGTVTYTVALKGVAPTSNVTVTPSSDDTDKATVSGALTFTPANYQQAQTVTVTGVAEGTATISHAVAGGGAGYSVTVADVGVTVAAVATATLSVSPNPVPEGGTVTVTIDLSEALEDAAVIPIVLTRGTAEAGDYGTLANIPIRAGSLRFTGRIRTNQDTDSDDETFTVALGALPAGVGAGSTSSVEVTIADDDVARVTLSVSPNPVLEGRSVTVTARLNRTLPGAVTVPLTLTNGTAEVGDYGALSGITITAGRTSATGTITTTQDDDTDDETFTVALGTLPAGVKEGATTSVEITITDDDARVMLSASPNPVVEGRSVTVTATLSRPASRAVTVPVTVTAGTAEASDMSALTGIRVARGSVSGTGRIATRQDADTDDETFTVTLDTANLPDILLAGGTTSVDITIDDDDTPRVSLSASPRRVTEGATVTVTATLSAALANDVTIPLTLTDGTAESGDHGSLASITITAGGTSATGTITTTQDDDTDDETFTVALDTANLPGTLLAGSPSSVQVTIIDDDAGVTLSASSTQVAEGRSVTVTARLNRRLTGDVTIPLALTNGTAEAGDYGALSGITITAGRTSATGTITTTQDDDTDDETFTVALGTLPATVKAGATTSVAITIVDDDARVTLSALPNPVTEGGTVTITATLSRPATRSVTVPITVTVGTAEASDMSALTGIRISRGGTTGTGRIATRQDDDTDDETFMVAVDTANLPETLLAGTTTSVAITIDDDDTPTVNLWASRPWVTAGESVTITAKLSAALPGDVTIPLTLTPENATSDDYGTLSSIRIAAGATSGSGTITTRQDADADYERFAVSLGSLPAAVQQGTRHWLRVTIAPADVPVAWLAVADKRIAEGESAMVTVNLTKSLTAPVTIPLQAAFNNGTVTGYQVTIAAGATSGTVDIATEQDADTNHEVLIVEIDTTGVPIKWRVEPYSSEHPNEVVILVRDDDAT